MFRHEKLFTLLFFFVSLVAVVFFSLQCVTQRSNVENSRVHDITPLDFDPRVEEEEEEEEEEGKIVSVSLK